MKTKRPRLLISNCLHFEKVRYNGQVIPFPFIERLSDYVDFIRTCPEVEIGLGVPRNPIRLVQKKQIHLVQPATGKDFTQEMIKFSENKVKNMEIDGAILKYGSPSCGIGNVKIYQQDIKRMPYKGQGMFAKYLLEGFPNLAIEDEGRLRNFTIRDHFLTKLFTTTRFRDVRTKKDLVEFHTKHKYLLMAYDETKMRELGRIVSGENNLKNYREKLLETMSSPPRFTRMINVLQHLFGGISSNLNQQEKKFFLDKIEEYRDERIPLSVVTNIIYSWALRFNDNYLLEQIIFEPFPKELIEVSDSGKGRAI